MYKKLFIDTYLKNNFSFIEAKSEIDFALSILFDFSYKDFMLGKSLENQQIEKIKRIIDERIKTHRPIQQIIGLSYFYGRKFFVDKYTLIPRPETELLVSNVLELSKKFSSPKILDIGSGSGCIPIALLLENTDITAHSVDISLEAIEISKKNASMHNVLNRISFFKSDLFENVKEKYNIIISNPPYIPLKDENSLEIEVRSFEPKTALFTNDELGIEFYEKITSQSKDYLLPNGYLVFELGINQADLVSDIIKANGFSIIDIIKDLNGIKRVTICKNDINYQFLKN